jgi:hypothetical protein
LKTCRIKYNTLRARGAGGARRKPRVRYSARRGASRTVVCTSRSVAPPGYPEPSDVRDLDPDPATSKGRLCFRSSIIAYCIAIGVTTNHRFAVFAVLGGAAGVDCACVARPRSGATMAGRRRTHPRATRHPPPHKTVHPLHYTLHAMRLVSMASRYPLVVLVHYHVPIASRCYCMVIWPRPQPLWSLDVVH